MNEWLILSNWVSSWWYEKSTITDSLIIRFNNLKTNSKVILNNIQFNNTYDKC